MENMHLCFQDEVKHQVCEKHEMSPSINIVDDEIVLICCCIDFKIKCYKIIVEALTTYKNEYTFKNYRIKPDSKTIYEMYLSRVN
jgi:hypothetical protein